MKKSSITLLLLASCLTMACSTNQTGEPEFEIKGVRLGMSIEEAAKGRDDLTIDAVMGWLRGADSFTLAGVNVGSAFVASHQDGLINNMSVTFPSENFRVIEGAFQIKYPALKCKTDKEETKEYGELEKTVCSAQRVRSYKELVVTDTMTIQNVLPTVSKLKNRKVGKLTISTNESDIIRNMRQEEIQLERPKPNEDI